MKTIFFLFLVIVNSSLAEIELRLDSFVTKAEYLFEGDEERPSMVRFIFEFKATALNGDVRFHNGVSLDETEDVMLKTGIRLLPTAVSSADVVLTSSYLELVSGNDQTDSLWFFIEEGDTSTFRAIANVEATQQGIIGLDFYRYSYHYIDGKLYGSAREDVEGIHSPHMRVYATAPEPSVGMCLLLGGATLLRRRRAK